MPKIGKRFKVSISVVADNDQQAVEIANKLQFFGNNLSDENIQALYDVSKTRDLNQTIDKIVNNPLAKMIAKAL
jgi:ribosomal protein L11 methylase PrmA